VNPSRCGRTVQGANRLGGELTKERIVKRLGETPMGRNAQWTKRPVIDNNTIS